ncbi:MAG TPA: S41 family peptidase [Candidatus Dormibacteraeota bacterium]|jgi:carboxyl-terminal processing protease|nr:S41 family peptidase [Candidatus Dormibacteraeota bacterium]
MSMKIKAAILVSSFAVLLFVVAGSFGGVHASSNDGSYRQMQVYSEVLSRVQSEYVEDPNIPKVTDGALHGLVESLDANSSYLTAAAYKAYKAHKAEAKGEIGATVSKRFGYADVVSVLPGSPAEKAGIEATDIFESIEGQSTRDMSLPEIRSALAGTPGSTVNVSVVRARRAEPQKMVISRDIVSIPPVSDKMLEDSVGYVKVSALTRGKAQEIAAKIKSLEKSGAKKLILDLRNTSEGEESEGVATANLFLNHGTITYLQGQKFPREAFNADAAKAITSLPVAVLVNKGTAGAAEVVAAALLENARGDVVGDKTFGDGSVQKTIDLPDGGALILSVAKYYSPSGKAIQETAVTPNVLVADETDSVISEEDGQESAPEPEAKPKNTQDDQLHKAIEVLKSRAS